MLLAGVVSTARAGPLPTVVYDTPGTTVNTGSTGIAGTFFNPGTVSVVGNTSSDNFNATHFDDGAGGGNNLGTGIQSNQALAAVIGANGSLTVGAWVNLDNLNGDNMVFGTDVGNPMHLGFRGGTPYFGFWGNDSSGGSVTPGQWHYWTWRYDASLGEQSIWEDGLNVFKSGGHGQYVNGGNLTVGTTGNNGGDLAGAIDDARVYNVALSDADILNLFNDAALSDQVVVPEPSSVVLAGIGGTFLLGGFIRRRRKTA